MTAVALKPSATAVAQDDCPGCGGDDLETSGPPAPGFTTIVRGVAFEQPDYHCRRCRRCGLIFKSVVASPEVLARYYDAVDHRKWQAPGLFPTEEAVLGALATLPPAARVLDFGCSTGRLLSRVTGRFECYGFEINREAASEASMAGLRMLVADELFAEDAGVKFDAITMVDVFEHLDRPTELLSMLSRRLTAGGRLILSTGNADCGPAQADPANFWYFRTIEHLCMATRRYVEFAAERLGLTVVEWSVMSHYRLSPAAKAAQWARTFAFEVFHRGRSPGLRPLVAAMPYLRRARRWPERPVRYGTADHVLVVLAKQSTPVDQAG